MTPNPKKSAAQKPFPVPRRKKLAPIIFLCLLVVGLIGSLIYARRTTPSSTTPIPSTNAPSDVIAVTPTNSPPVSPASGIPGFDEMQDYEKATALSARGSEYIAARQYTQAVDALREALKYDPAMEDVHYNLGISFAKLGIPRDAIIHYNKAIDLAPDYAEAHNNLGNLLVQLGRLDEAIGHFQEAIKIDPQNPINFNNLGTALGKRGRYSEAAEQFIKAISLSPKYLEARYNLGNAYLEQGLLDDAEREFKELVQLSPQFAPAQKGLAKVAAKKASR